MLGWSRARARFFGKASMQLDSDANRWCIVVFWPTAVDQALCWPRHHVARLSLAATIPLTRRSTRPVWHRARSCHLMNCKCVPGTLGYHHRAHTVRVESDFLRTAHTHGTGRLEQTNTVSRWRQIGTSEQIEKYIIY